LNELPEVDLFLLTHNHYDHLSTRTIQRFPYKKAKVLTPLKLGKYFTRNGYGDVDEMDWYDEIKINNLKVTLVPAVHWSKRSLWDTNKTLWGSFIIEYQGMKIFFACDTGYGNIYKDLGKKYGPIDLTLINIGAYNFYPMTPVKDKSIYHTNPEEALQIGKDLKSKKMLGMHWGTVILSLEPILEPAKRFKNSANQFGYSPDDAIIFKIGQVEPIENIF
jgi:Predicted Zn-dependent hydrolases of the beta-lactamase fold